MEDGDFFQPPSPACPPPASCSLSKEQSLGVSWPRQISTVKHRHLQLKLVSVVLHFPETMLSEPSRLHTSRLVEPLYHAWMCISLYNLALREKKGRSGNGPRVDTRVNPLKRFCWCQSAGQHAFLSDSLRPHGLQPTSLLCPRDFPGKHTRASCPSLLQGILETWGSSRPGDRTWVCCTGRSFFTTEPPGKPS